MANTGKSAQSVSNGETRDGEPRDLAEMDLKRVLLQQLQSYQASGLTSLPVGRGEHSFSWSQFADDTAEGAVGAAAEVASTVESSKLAAKVAETVHPPTTETGQGSPVTASSDAGPAAAGAAKSGPADESVPGSELQLPYPQSLPLAQRQQQLTVLQDLVAGCTRCEELASTRTQTVFGVGNATPRLVFVGEGPGADEDRLGEPFVGAAGQLLDKIMSACQLTRDQVYILNVVKCRPPRNRNPSDEERSHCWGYARQQLEILQPEFICCLGSVAAKSLLNTKQPLGKMRQQFHAYRGSRVIVTYHPAYLLRTPSAKRHVWEDMKLLMKAMGVDL